MWIPLIIGRDTMYKTCIACNQLNRKVLFYFSAMCPHPDLL